MKFSDIEQFPQCSYRTTVPWSHLERWLEGQQNEGLAKLDLNPDFQRAHVWTKEQQTAYVEYILRGGTSGKEIYLNCTGWMNDFRGPYVIVDGKQRLEAARAFLRNDLPVFSHTIKEFEDKFPFSMAEFSINIAKLDSREDVLNWYIQFNQGGTPHSKEELDRVRKLIEAEKSKG